LHKKKGQEALSDRLVLEKRLIEPFVGKVDSRYFIDWESPQALSEKEPKWRSYIMLSFDDGGDRGILSISVDIAEKEFDFSNLNFVTSMRPVIKHILFDKHE